jgi:hypothetical protein
MQLINEIWKNTRKFRTSGEDITTLFDLFDGLLKCGFRCDPYQRQDHLELTELVVFPESKLKGVISNLEADRNLNLETKGFTMRFGSYDEYKNGRLGLPPTSVLRPDDFVVNPLLFGLLYAQFGKYEYYRGNILFEENPLEVITKDWKFEREGSYKICPLSPQEARIKAAKNTGQLAELVRRENFPMSFNGQFVLIGEEEMYQVTIIPNAALRIRQLRKDYEKRKGNDRAKEGIEKAINIHELAIEKGEGDYYPCYKRLSA